MRLLKYLKKGYLEYKLVAKSLHEHTCISVFRLKADMLKCAILYGARPSDYAMFSFYKKSNRERNRFMTNYRWLKLLKMCDLSGGGLANAKDKEYKLFRNFIKHDWFILKNGDRKTLVADFLDIHETAIAKPVHGTLGLGIVKLFKGNSIDSLLQDDEDYIIEECLKNTEEIAIFNASSLNTFRVFTYVGKDGNINIHEIILRIGIPGSIVDNWGAGGIIYHVDIESGVIDRPGIDKHLKQYIYHPGSQIKMVGYKLECIDCLKEYVLSLAKTIPTAKVVGWDIALTPNGFDFIELNCPGGHDILQVFDIPFWSIVREKIM